MKLLRAKLGLAIVILVVVGISFKVTAQELTKEFQFERCQIQHKAVEMDAECATLSRPENPNKPNGKVINLFVVKLPSSSAEPESDAFTIIQGGPGGSSIDMAISHRHVLNIIRAKRDVLIVDQRGTGRSNILQCDEAEDQILSSAFDRALTLDLTKKCAAKLNQNDLRYYTTSIAVQDLEAVRIAANYPQLTVYGVSYGTRVAQHYLRRYPSSTRALVIDGVADIGLNLAGSEISLRSQDAFDSMVKRCKQTPSCIKQFGDIAIKFKELRQRLISSPVKLKLAHPLSGKKISHTVRESDLLTAVRMMPYSTEVLSLLPMLISQAHSGDYTLLAAQSINIQDSFSNDFASGMHNSIVCTEDAPFVNKNAADETLNTYFGRDMIDGLSTICEAWPQGFIDDDFHESFDSEKPVLILSGETDPITPPINGERAAKMFSNSKHIVVPSHGHGVFARGCVPFLIRDFISNTNLNKLKSDCITRERVMPFFIDTAGPTP